MESHILTVYGNPLASSMPCVAMISGSIPVILRDETFDMRCLERGSGAAGQRRGDVLNSDMFNGNFYG